MQCEAEQASRLGEATGAGHQREVSWGKGERGDGLGAEQQDSVSDWGGW